MYWGVLRWSCCWEPHLRHPLQVSISAAVIRTATWLTHSIHVQCCSCRVYTQLWEKEPQESQTGTPPPGFLPTSNHHRHSSQTTVLGFLCCQPIERKPQRWYHDMKFMRNSCVIVPKNNCVGTWPQALIYLYISLAAFSTWQATVLSGGYSKDDTTYDLSYLLSGPSWEKPADLVFIRSMVGESEPFHWTWLTFSFRLSVLRVKDRIPEPRAYLLVEECGPEENIWRGKRLCLSFLGRSSFLLKKI